MKNYMIEAFDLKRKGCYKQAIELYYKLLSEEGENVEIFSELADLYFLLNNKERALHYINRALELEPKHINSQRILIKIYMSENNYYDALNNAKDLYNKTKSNQDLAQIINILESQNKFEEILSYENSCEDNELLYKISLAKFNLKLYDSALETIEKISFESNDDFEETVLNLKTKIYYELNETDKAKEVYKKLEDKKIKTAEGFNYTGLNKLDELKLDEAIDLFNKAIEKEAGNATYHYNLGQAYFLKGWIDEAKKCFNTAICLNPEEEKYHYSMGYLLYKIGEYNNALAQLNPDYPESKILIQVIKSESGDMATPKIELEKLLNIYPNNELILYSLAKIYYNLGMFKQSKTIIDKLITINSNNFDYYNFQVKLMLKLSMINEAEKQVSFLVEKYPNYYYAKVLEAEVNLAKEDYDELFETAQELIELDINHFEGYYYNALALFEKNDINFAIESLKKAISLDVCNADLYVKMSEFYKSIGRTEDALAYIKEASDIDKSAKNQELYMQLAGIIRKNNISEK